MEQALKPTTPQSSIETTPFVVATVPKPLSPRTDHVPIETSTPIPPVPDVRAAVSHAENALHDADEATKAISLPSTWEGAVTRIKWVMDTVSPAAGVRHSAISFYLMLDRAAFPSASSVRKDGMWSAVSNSQGASICVIVERKRWCHVNLDARHS